ncbi:MAG: hypothetical protein ACLQU1_10920 [Bryobacteraceae bacterium]
MAIRPGKLTVFELRESQLRSFDQATERNRQRQSAPPNGLADEDGKGRISTGAAALVDKPSAS